MPDNPAVVSFRFPDLAAARQFYVDELGFTITRDADEHENMTIAFGGAQMMIEDRREPTSTATTTTSNRDPTWPARAQLDLYRSR